MAKKGRRPRLTLDNCRAIRQLYGSGKQSAEQLARMFRVSSTTVLRVIERRRPYGDT